MREHHRRTEGSVASEGPSHGEWSLPRENSIASSPNIDYFDDETPRHSMELDRLVSWVPPASPVGNRKTRSRAGPFIPRTDSLKESKVLMVTGMRRTESIIEPELFHYHDHFEFLGLIGETQTSEVFRVKQRQSGEVFAVKRSRKRFRSKLQRERCLREIQAVAALPAHDNIVAQYRAWQEGGHFYIQMDYCDGGSLHDVLHSGGVDLNLRGEELWKVAFDVAKGLSFLHANNVLHLDIKPENLYRKVEKDGSFGSWKIGDFGLAIGKETKDWEEGDGDYVAPELLKSGSEPLPSADVFCLGATIFECATGKKLPRKDGLPQFDVHDLHGDTDLELLLKSMTLTDPFERPTAVQVMEFSKFMLQQESVDAPVNEKKKLPSLSPTESQRAINAEIVSKLNVCEPDQTEDANPCTEFEARGVKFRLPMLKIPQPPSYSNPNTSRTNDTSGSFRIRKRDPNITPGRDILPSTSDSEAYSFGDTLGSMSDMEYPDILSPKSHREHSFGPLSSRLLQGAGSLNFDMSNSPDVALSNQSSPARGKIKTRLDISQKDVDESVQSLSGRTTGRSTSGAPVISVWNEFGDQEKPSSTRISARGGASYKSPFEEQRGENKNKKIPSLHIPQKNFGKKRQHSSRKLAVNKGNNSDRSNDVSSARSIDNLMPQKKGARFAHMEFHGQKKISTKDAENIAPLKNRRNKRDHCPVAMAAQMHSMTLTEGNSL
ncbi:hypothetical protein M9435_000802 [Picochlorum sp. BPE23]|nr:hypothetical protein M9435_000802 [Picochlorum sp. BPE23]